MSKTIYEKLEINVCKILCDGDHGTGFLISNELILTAFHVINGCEKIKVTFDNKEEIEVTLHELIDDKYKELDIAILKLNKSVDFYEDIPISDIKIQHNAKWISRGFPSFNIESGENILEHINNVINGQNPLSNSNNIRLDFNQKLDTYQGFSGAPLIINDLIVGIIKDEQLERGISKQLNALTVKHFKCLLEKLQIPISSKKDHFKIILDSLDNIKKKEKSISRIFLIFTEDNITNNKYKVTGYIHDNDEFESNFLEFTFENIHNEEEQEEFLEILLKESELDNVPVHFILPASLFLINFKQCKYKGTELINIYHVLFHNKDRFSRKISKYNSMKENWDDKFSKLKDKSINESLLSIPNKTKAFDNRDKLGAYFSYQPDVYDEIERIVDLANIVIWKYSREKVSNYEQWLASSITLGNINKESRKCNDLALLWDEMSLLENLRGKIE